MKKEVIQKIFCYISFLFILSCCIFYGTRFIKLFLEEKQKQKIEKNTLVKVIKENNINNNNFKDINNIKYFVNDSNNNYILYSNILWRIIKVNDDNSLTVISDSSLTSLAYGENLEYTNSYINKWLNTSDNEYSGILEKQLNNVDKYLQVTNTCLDKINTLDNKECENISNNNYISLLSTNDFVNIGNKESYVINNEYFYLNNTNDNLEVWYVDSDGKVTTSKGKDIIGIRPVITIKSNVDYVSGNGTKEKPYTIEKEKGYFGSYVKLGNDIWRVYQDNDKELRLLLNDYLKVNNSIFKYNYSANNNNSFNTKTSNSVAYYLNNTFLNSLSYKNKLNTVKWNNGYYGTSTNFDYEDALKNKAESKVASISIGDIRLNNKLDNYLTLTGTQLKGTLIYTINTNQKLSTKTVTTKVNIVPTISINKELLTKGTGSYEEPFEME